MEVDLEGGLKRCGGQGDVLSGAVGTFMAWGKCYEDGAFGDKKIPASRIPLLAAIGGKHGDTQYQSYCVWETR